MYTIKINDEKGLVIAVKVVREEDEIVLISQKRNCNSGAGK